MRKACYIALPLKKGSAVHTILHDMRVKPPSYCVKKSIENETHATSKIFDYSSLLETEEKRWAQASPQALHKKNYSPLWQGVLVLDKGYTVNANLKKAEGFTKEIEKQFGLKCLGLSVHHDEGHKDEKGNINLNPHAHIVFDRCNDDGKIIRLLRKDLMKIQNLASLYSGLQRGTPNYKKERPTKHIHHSEYRRLATEKVKSLSNTLDEIKNNNVFTAINDGLLQNKDLGMTLCSDLIKNNFEQYNIHQLHNLAKSQYQFTRSFYKESGQAQQVDYSNLKKAYKLIMSSSNKKQFDYHYQYFLKLEIQFIGSLRDTLEQADQPQPEDSPPDSSPSL